MGGGDGRIDEIDGPHKTATEAVEPEEEEALQAELAARRTNLYQMENMEVVSVSLVVKYL